MMPRLRGQVTEINRDQPSCEASEGPEYNIVRPHDQLNDTTFGYLHNPVDPPVDGHRISTGF